MKSNPSVFLTLYCLLHASTLEAAAPEALQVCVNFGCKQEQQVTLEPKQWRQLEQLFASRPKTAAEERGRIAQAIGWLEGWAGAQTGTSADKARNLGAGEPGQLDCIAESKNSRRYLQLMARQGWLWLHRVKPRERRAPWFFDSHWTAVIEAIDTEETFAVDSWFFANGTAASILPLQDWYRKQDPD